MGSSFNCVTRSKLPSVLANLFRVLAIEGGELDLGKGFGSLQFFDLFFVKEISVTGGLMEIVDAVFPEVLIGKTRIDLGEQSNRAFEFGLPDRLLQFFEIALSLFRECFPILGSREFLGPKEQERETMETTIVKVSLPDIALPRALWRPLKRAPM